MSGHLCYQIGHHLFPDLPYTTGSLPRQYLRVLGTLHRLSLPDTVVGPRWRLGEAA